MKTNRVWEDLCEIIGAPDPSNPLHVLGFVATQALSEYRRLRGEDTVVPEQEQELIVRHLAQLFAE